MHPSLRRTLFVLGTLLYTADASAQAPANVVDSAFALIRTRSVHRDRVNWSDVERDFRLRLSRAATLDDSLSAFRGVFGAMDDVHSSVVWNGRAFSHYREATAEEAAAVGPLIARANVVRGKVEGRMIGRDVGYIMVPTISAGSSEIARYASEIRETVCRLVDAGASRWIIDLRLNMGGNMHPMLTGLGPLIGEGEIGGIVDRDEQRVIGWSIRDGVNYLNDAPTMRIAPPRCAVAPDQPIAVLVGRITMSSGQMVAVSLVGRPRTRSFGTATADGYITANLWMPLSDEVALNLASGFVADRRGRVYRRFVEPDELVDSPAQFDDPAADRTVQQAMAWLRARPRD